MCEHAGMPDLRHLTRQFPLAGRLEAVLLRPARDAPAVSVPSVLAQQDRGLEGDLAAARKLFADQALHITIGDDLVLLATGPCDPLSKMEQALGPGAYNAMRGHGGLTARVLVGGRMEVGDVVRVRG